MKIKLLENLLNNCYNYIDGVNDYYIRYKINDLYISINYSKNRWVPINEIKESDAYEINIDGITYYISEKDINSRIKRAEYLTLMEDTINKYREDLLFKLVNETNSFSTSEEL